MSSRALRKLQKGREQEAQLSTQSDDNEEEILEQKTPVTGKANVFDMLNAAEEEDLSSQETEEDPDLASRETSQKQISEPSTEKGKSKKAKKKKPKKKARVKESAGLEPHKDDRGFDEIDRALRALSTKPGVGQQDFATPETIERNNQLFRLLEVESRHLNALNEMKRLFGKVVLESEEEPQAQPRRRGRAHQQLDLAGALAARNSPVARGQGLSGPTMRRNFFIQGKEEWPKATGGGLGMELVGNMDDGTVEYRFVHNTIYQDVQRQFESCVESMDPQRLISMLVFNPYHVSTLLQVSEIAKQQGDHSVAGDLLERALFTFGRSVHSSFTSALGKGRARLDQRRPENREFWLAAWRYTINLGQRGTWRTAFEWAKLMLSLDPEGDPYCVGKVIDQIAIRGGQAELFLELSRSDFYSDDLWSNCPNIAISSALAEHHLKNPIQARTLLERCVQKYPWIFARLFQELNLDRIPKAIWGTSPRTPAEKLDCEVYVHNAKDLWNTPEATTILVEVAESVEQASPDTPDTREISVDEARYALLTAVPSITQCIPRTFTNQPTSASDPLPPSRSLISYDPTLPAGHGISRNGEEDGEDASVSDDEDIDGASARERVVELEAGAMEGERGQRIMQMLREYLPWMTASRDRVLSGDSEVARGGNQGTRAVAPTQDRSMEPTTTNESNSSRRPAPSPLRAFEFERQIASLLRQATVEDGEEEVEEEGTSSSNVPPSTTSNSANGSSNSNSNNNENTTSIPANPVNWLAGGGLMALSGYTSRHGLDSKTWPSPSLHAAPPSGTTTTATTTTTDPQPKPTTTSSPSQNEESSVNGHELLRTYAERILALPGGEGGRERRFLLDYRIPQGAGEGVKKLVEEEIRILKG